MTDILNVVRVSWSATRTSLWVEVPVPEDVEQPIYLTGSRQGLWVPPSRRRNTQRSSVRYGARPPGEDFNTLLDLSRKAKSESWGSVFRDIRQLPQAVSYLESYGVQDVRILVPPGSDLKEHLVFLAKRDRTCVIEVPWLPEGLLCVLPIDLDYFGDLIVGDNWWTQIIHSPRYSVAFLGPWCDDPKSPSGLRSTPDE